MAAFTAQVIHQRHLHAALRAAQSQTPTPHVLFSYVRWRGWLPNDRLLACGGGWGGPYDALKQMNAPVRRSWAGLAVQLPAS